MKQASACKQWSVGSKQFFGLLLPTTYCLLSTAYSIHYLLPATHFLNLNSNLGEAS